MKTIQRRHFLGLGVSAVGIMAVSACSEVEAPSRAAAAAAPPDPAYATLVVAPGKTGPTNLGSTLAAARTAGLIKTFTLVDSRPSEEGPVGFGRFAIVEFTDQAAYDSWKAGSAASLGPDVAIKQADLLVDDRAKVRGPAPVYVVNYYDALIPPEDYVAYTRSYISPNMDGQKAGGVMTGYAMYFEREPTGAHHRTVLVKEYVDEAAFARIDEVKLPNEERLKQNPEWARIAREKARYRTDVSATKAVPAAQA